MKRVVLLLLLSLILVGCEDNTIEDDFNESLNDGGDTGDDEHEIFTIIRVGVEGYSPLAVIDIYVNPEGKFLVTDYIGVEEIRQKIDIMLEDAKSRNLSFMYEKIVEVDGENAFVLLAKEVEPTDPDYIYALYDFLNGKYWDFEYDLIEVRENELPVKLEADCIGDAGWTCRYIDPPEILAHSHPNVREADAELLERCEADGGRFRCYGFCSIEYERYCDLPFSDAGKECTDSSQCQGLCVDYSGCEENCVGTCAEYTLRYCDSPAEVVDGTVMFQNVLCD